jgi:hypothetical protein
MKRPRKLGAVNDKNAARKPRNERGQLAPSTSADESEDAIRRMVEAGLLRPASKHWRMPPFTPRPLRGELIVRTIREERVSD